MGGMTLAWLTGEVIIIWQQVTREHHPPIPGRLLGSSALFALLAIAAEYSPARPVATALAWGFDLAALLQVLPAGIGGGTTGQPGGKVPNTTPAPLKKRAGGATTV